MKMKQTENLSDTGTGLGRTRLQEGKEQKDGQMVRNKSRHTMGYQRERVGKKR